MSDSENGPLLHQCVHDETSGDMSFSVDDIKNFSCKSHARQESFDDRSETDEKGILHFGEGSILEHRCTELQPANSIFRALPEGKEYHLFVAYSSEDKEDAQSLCSELRKRFSLKCMDYEHDFQPGKGIDDNINDEMSKSVKVLLVVTPNFLKSHWCDIEARMAYELSFTHADEMNVITLLLRPLLKDTDVPSYMKIYQYIDADKTEDVPAAINKAFHVSGTVVQSIHQRVISKERLQRSNGVRLLYKSTAVGKRTHICNKICCDCCKTYKPYFLFDFLDNKDKEDLRTLEVNCENQYNSLVNDLNSTCMMRLYPSMKSFKWLCATSSLFAIFLTCLFLGVAYTAYIYTSDDQRRVYDITQIIFLMTIIPFWVVSMCACRCARTCFSNYIPKILWRQNRQFYKETKCILYFDDTNQWEPTEYIIDLLKKRHSDNTTDIEMMAVKMIENQLEILQRRNLFFKWQLLPDSMHMRHDTWQNKSCLCEMIEKEIISSTPKDIHALIV